MNELAQLILIVNLAVWLPTGATLLALVFIGFCKKRRQIQTERNLNQQSEEIWTITGNLHMHPHLAYINELDKPPSYSFSIEDPPTYDQAVQWAHEKGIALPGDQTNAPQ